MCYPIQWSKSKVILRTVHSKNNYRYLKYICMRIPSLDIQVIAGSIFSPKKKIQLIKHSSKNTDEVIFGDF